MILTELALALPILLGVALAWGLLEPYVIDVEEHDVALPALPDSWRGRRVALIADLQLGMWMGNTWTIERVVRRIVREHPAVVLIAGDFVYGAGGDGRQVRRVTRLLRPLVAAGLSTYAVLGNHDYDMSTERDRVNQALATELHDSLEETGIEVLDNEAVALPTPAAGAIEAGDAGPAGEVGAPLYLVGLGAHEPGRDRQEAAFAEVPTGAARLVLMHHPNSFEALPACAAPLALAGHTHGRQVRVPFTRARTRRSRGTGELVHATGFGHAGGAAGNTLYVNRGIGFSVVPLRIGCPPELTLFTLERAGVDA